MVALQALSEYAKLTVSDGRVVARVSLNANQLTETLSLDSSNAMQVQTITVSHSFNNPYTYLASILYIADKPANTS